MSEKETDRVYSVSEKISHREIEGQILLLRPDDHFLYTLNGSGKFIWQEIVRKRPVSGISKSLSKKFDIPEEKANKDVLSFVRDLEKKGIIIKAKK